MIYSDFRQMFSTENAVDGRRSLEGRILRKADGQQKADRRQLMHDPEKWIPVFRKRSCSTKDLERDDDST
jgi:hypothetical protein